MSEKILWNNFKSYKYRASKKEIKFDLPYRLFKELSLSECYICNKLDDNFNGIDRINNDIGYTVNNSFSCCWTCNRAKSNMSIELFTVWIEKFNINKANEIRERYKETLLKTKHNTIILDIAKNEQLNNTLYSLNKNFMPKFIAHRTDYFKGTKIHVNTFFLKGNYFALFTLSERISKLDKGTLHNIKEVNTSGKKEYAVEFNYTPFNDLLDHIYVEYLTIDKTTELLYPQSLLETDVKIKFN